MGPLVTRPPLRPDELRRIMPRHEGSVDACIVGSGAAGGVLAKELAEAGMTVVVLEAGDWLDTRTDLVNDELSMLGRIDWDDLRISDGQDPLRLGRVNTGRAVGGTTVHYTAMALRLDPSDFHVASSDGVASNRATVVFNSARRSAWFASPGTSSGSPRKMTFAPAFDNSASFRAVSRGIVLHAGTIRAR